MSTLLARAASIPPAALPGTVLVALQAAAVEVAVRRVPLPRLARVLGVPLCLEPDRSVDAGQGPSAADTPAAVQRPPLTARERRRIEAIGRVLRHWPFATGTCLREALLVGHTLRHRQPVLRLGVRRDDDGPTAHAWVEVQGTVIGDDRRSVPLQEHIDG